MSGCRTADEIRNEYLEKMGPQLGADFHALWQDLAWLYVKWIEYVEIFGTSPDREFAQPRSHELVRHHSKRVA